MAFDINDVLRFNDKQSVDAAFSPIIEKNLFKDATFVNGVTYTNKHQMKAGQIFVRKLGKPAVRVNDPAGAAVNGLEALDFEHTLTADTLIPIVLDTNISTSEKVYRAVGEARIVPADMEAFELAVEGVKEKFQVKAAAALIAGSKASANTAASTANTILGNILADRKAIRDAGGKPDVLVVSTRIYTILLNELSDKKFIPVTNEEVLKTGQVGWLYGFKVFESNLLDDGGLNAQTEYILYDHEAFSIITSLEAARTVPAVNFVGVYAQCQTINGFKVTNADLAIKKTVVVADPAIVTLSITDTDGAVTGTTNVIKTGSTVGSGDAVTAETDGTYELDAGVYNYSVSKTGYTTKTGVFTIAAESQGQEVTIDIVVVKS